MTTLAFTPSPDQQAALNRMHDWLKTAQTFSDTEPFVLTGAAGTGKTSLVDAFIDQNHLNRDNIVGIAISAIAAQNIADHTRIGKPMTVASYIKSPTPVITIDTHLIGLTGPIITCKNIQALLVILENKILPQLTQLPDERKQLAISFVKNAQADAQESLDTQSVNDALRVPDLIKSTVQFVTRTDQTTYNINQPPLLIVDEISMIGDDDITDICHRAQLSDTPVLCLGDPYQLQPIGAEPTKLLTDRPGDKYRAHLSTPHRQNQNSWLNVFASHLYPPEKADVLTALNAVDKQAKTTNGPDFQLSDIALATPESLAKQTDQQLGTFLNQHDIVLTEYNATIQTLTKLMRHAKFNIPSSIVTLNTRFFVHDRIMITVNEPLVRDSGTGEPLNEDTRLTNGMLGVITKTYSDAEVEQFFSQSGEHDPNHLYRDYKALSLKCVDVDFGTKTHPRLCQHLILNGVEIDNPKITSTILQNTQKYHRYPLRYKMFNAKLDSQYQQWAEQNILVDDAHPQINYATFGYAMTVYKAQGHEWPNVVYYKASGIRNRHSNDYRIDYTTITRAKSKITILLKKY